jgi:two-component system, NarL family, sensor kinase
VRRRPRRGTPRAHSSEITGAVSSFVFMGLTALALVALPTVLVIEHVAERHAMAEAVKGGRNVARRLLAPDTTTAAIAGDPAALARLDRDVRGRIRDGSVARVKIWDATGRIVYSDEAALIGRRYPLPRLASTALHTDGAIAERASAEDLENELESDPEGLVEVYVSASASTGEQLVFETYFPARMVRRAQQELLIQMLPVALAALLALSLAQLPLALRLARRVQRGRLERERLLAQTAAAADLERRRLAAELHDDVLQDLAGVGYALASIRAAQDGRSLPVLEQAGATVRRDVRLLRDLVTDLYPPRLDTGDLTTVLEGLGNGLHAVGVRYRADVQPAVRLTATAATLVYRVARESVAHARKHAHASGIVLRLAQVGTVTTLTVTDDGVGFDPSPGPVPGHFGLTLAQDIVTEAGGALTVRSRTGSGTQVELVLRQT